MYEGNAIEVGVSKPLPFEVKSGKLHVSDPCYSKGGGYVIENARRGRWFGQVGYTDEDGWGIRVGWLKVWHEDEGDSDDFPVCSETIPYEPGNPFGSVLGVDSGQMSFFDYDAYPEDPHSSSFYDEVCEWTLKCPTTADLVEFGVYAMRGKMPKPGETPNDFRKRMEEAGRQVFIYPEGQLNSGIYVASSMHSFVRHHGFGNFGGNESGVASSTGFGDGGYPLEWNVADNGEVTAAIVTFIVEADPEDEEDEN